MFSLCQYPLNQSLSRLRKRLLLTFSCRLVSVRSENLDIPVTTSSTLVKSLTTAKGRCKGKTKLASRRTKTAKTKSEYLGCWLDKLLPNWTRRFFLQTFSLSIFVFLMEKLSFLKENQICFLDIWFKQYCFKC